MLKIIAIIALVAACTTDLEHAPDAAPTTYADATTPLGIVPGTVGEAALYALRARCEVFSLCSGGSPSLCTRAAIETYCGSHDCGAPFADFPAVLKCGWNYLSSTTCSAYPSTPSCEP